MAGDFSFKKLWGEAFDDKENQRVLIEGKSATKDILSNIKAHANRLLWWF